MRLPLWRGPLPRATHRAWVEHGSILGKEPASEKLRRTSKSAKPTGARQCLHLTWLSVPDRFKRFQIILQQLQDELVVVGVPPAIAVDATDQNLTAMIDFD
jgi:hypothetical protein